MATIKVASKQANREVSITEPNVLGLTTLAELAEALGEDLCINQIKQQSKIGFRAMVRRKLEEVDDNGDFVNSDENVMDVDYSDWKPTLRITKTPEEKALEAFGALTPEDRKALLASLQE